MRCARTMRLGFALALGTAVVAVTPVAARECVTVPSTVLEVQQAVAAGTRLAAALEARDPEVAIVARIGSDQSDRGIRYTHAGLSWRDHPQGRWHFVHLLNHCGSGESDLFDDGPVGFFLERPFRYDALVLVPSAEVQQGLGRLLREGFDGSMHEPAYSAIAHPFDDRFQNSNQWVLELVALALAPEGPRTRAFAQQVLRRRDYRPERVRLGFFERVGARRMDNVKLSDHRRSELREGGYLYVSVVSVARFLDQAGALEESFELPASTVLSTARP